MSGKNRTRVPSFPGWRGSQETGRLLAYNRGIVALELFVLIFTVAAGLVTGSYLNVLIHRLPRGQSTVLPRSRCPYCDGSVRAIDNIPLLSFLLLGGRCRRCGAPISWRYPLIEALTALLFVLCLFRFGLTARAAASILFCCLMLALALIDLEHYLLPDKITLPGIVAGLEEALRSYHQTSRSDVVDRARETRENLRALGYIE